MGGVGVRVLVCGGRHYDPDDAERWLLRHALARVEAALGPPSWRLALVIHGACGAHRSGRRVDYSGADEGAERWAALEGVEVTRFPADWATHGRSAGPIRNSLMLAEGRPDVVIAFPGGRGTEDMVRKARAAGVPVIEVEAGRGEE